MPRYEWRGASAYHDNRNDRHVEPDDVVELDAHVGGPHPEFVPVDADTDDRTPTEEASVPFDPGSKTVDELGEAVADVDDAAALAAVRDAEVAGDDRTSAVDVIDRRLNSLEE